MDATAHEVSDAGASVECGEDRVGGSWRVLIVEDDPLDAILMIERLRAGGAEATTRVVADRASFEAALTDPPGLILCDFSLSGFDAFGALDLLRERSLDIPLIVVSGAISEEQAVECMRRGAADYLLKDRLGRLVTAVERALENHRQRTEAQRSVAIFNEHAGLLGAIFDTTTDGLVVVDRAGRIVELNAAAQRLAEIAAAPMAGGVAGAGDALADVLRGIVAGGPPCGEVKLLELDGAARIVTYSAVVGFMPDRTLIVVHDVTEQRALQAQSVERQRMESIGRLAGGIAHDFNNILAAIVTFAELALVELPEEAAGRTEVVEILNGADRASALIRQILAFSRRQILQPTRVNLAAVVADFDAMLRRPLGSRIALSVEASDEPAIVFADRTQLGQVIVNLVVNARDAMPDGGSIKIRIGHETIGARPGRRLTGPLRVRPGRYVRLEVSDTGVGMDPATCDHIFEPFFTTKGAGRGTGLGLATAYGIVQQSKGAIWVDSRPGEGSRFVILLPAVDAIAPDAIAAQPATATLPRAAMPRVPTRSRDRDRQAIQRGPSPRRRRRSAGGPTWPRPRSAGRERLGGGDAAARRAGRVEDLRDWLEWSE